MAHNPNKKQKPSDIIVPAVPAGEVDPNAEVRELVGVSPSEEIVIPADAVIPPPDGETLGEPEPIDVEPAAAVNSDVEPNAPVESAQVEPAPEPVTAEAVSEPVPADRHPEPKPAEPNEATPDLDAEPTVELLMQEIGQLRAELFDAKVKLGEISSDPIDGEEVGDDNFYHLEKSKVDHLVYALIWAPTVGLYQGRTGIIRLAGVFGVEGSYEDCRKVLAAKRDAVLAKNNGKGL